MGFAESLSTLSMDKHERDRYYEMANSSDPAMRKAAREKLNGNKVTPMDLVRTYAQARVTAKMEFQKEQYSDMKHMIQNLTRDDPTYDSISPIMQDRLKAVYASKEKDASGKNEKNDRDILSEVNERFASVLPQEPDQYDGVDGPEME